MSDASSDTDTIAPADRPKLTGTERDEYLARAERVYARVADTDDGSLGFTLHAPKGWYISRQNSYPSLLAYLFREDGPGSIAVSLLTRHARVARRASVCAHGGTRLPSRLTLDEGLRLHTGRSTGRGGSGPPGRC